MTQNIFLCGFMGCGKTTTGLELAKISGMNYLDLDEYIQETQNLNIPEIFAQFGESRFREIETNAIKTLSAEVSNTVIACGGGAMLNPANAENARKSGDVIFLDVPFEACYRRIQDDTNRPLVMNNTKDQLKDLYKNRYPFYEKNSSVIISIAENDTPINIAGLILQAII